MLNRFNLVTAGALMAALGAILPSMPNLSPEWATWIENSLRAAGVFVVYLASNRNPDGTSAKVAYEPPTKLGGR